MDKLGIDPLLLITQTINFLIVLFVLKKFLYKPILKVLDERRKKIEEGLAWSEKAKEEEVKLLAKKDEIVKAAKEEAKIVIAEAKKEAEKVHEKIIAEAKKEAVSNSAKLERELKARYEEQERELANQTIDIAAAMVKKVLPQLLSEADQQKVLLQQLKKVQSLHE